MFQSETYIAGGKARQFTVSKIESVFNFYEPKPPLSRFVDRFWLFEGSVPQTGSARILPTGTLELAINLREDQLGIYDAATPENCLRFSGAVVSGASRRGFAPDTAEEAFILGVHFKPGGAFPFLGLPAGDLADSHVGLEELWGHAAGRLRERICEARTAKDRFELLEAALMERLCGEVEQHYAVSAALELFGKERGGPRVSEAAKDLGLSQRRFIDVFKAEVGITPKLFSRIQRFQHARSIIQRNPFPDWAAIELDLGYFDQSHLIREF